MILRTFELMRAVTRALESFDACSVRAKVASISMGAERDEDAEAGSGVDERRASIRASWS